MLNESLKPLALTINGSKLAVGQRPSLSELDPALRSVALSDSPIIIKAPASDQSHLVSKLHKLGRRSSLPLRQCTVAEEAYELFDAVEDSGDTKPGALGTWVLYNINSWPISHQQRLSRVLEALDLGRLHGRLRHEKIPRVIVVTSQNGTASMPSDLEKRISYFRLTAELETKE